MVQVNGLFEKNWGAWNAPDDVQMIFTFVDCGSEIVVNKKSVRSCVVAFCSQFRLSEKSAAALIEWIDSDLLKVFSGNGVACGQFPGAGELGRVCVDLGLQPV